MVWILGDVPRGTWSESLDIFVLPGGFRGLWRGCKRYCRKRCPAMGPAVLRFSGIEVLRLKNSSEAVVVYIRYTG
jgi:hypothetical protein